jgi:hypothetical protein
MPLTREVSFKVSMLPHATLRVFNPTDLLVVEGEGHVVGGPLSLVIKKSSRSTAKTKISLEILDSPGSSERSAKIKKKITKLINKIIIAYFSFFSKIAYFLGHFLVFKKLKKIPNLIQMEFFVETSGIVLHPVSLKIFQNACILFGNILNL